MALLSSSRFISAGVSINHVGCRVDEIIHCLHVCEELIDLSLSLSESQRLKEGEEQKKGDGNIRN